MDKLAVSARKMCCMILEAGCSLDDCRSALSTLDEPTEGYYYVCDVLAYINKLTCDMANV